MIKFCFATVIAIVLLFSCGSVDSDQTSSEGNVDLRLWVDPGPAKPSLRETNWSDLIINIISSELDTIIDTLTLETDDTFNSFLLSNIKSDIHQTITINTIDEEGDTIHGPATDTFTIAPGETVVLTMELFPVKGSMYLMLSHFPSYIDSVAFSYTTPTQIFYTKERKSTKFFTSLDKIPYNSVGTISINGYDNSNTERISWFQTNFVFTADNVTLEADFLDIGNTQLDVTIHEPGITLIWGIMNETISADIEVLSLDSQLIISEIMSSAGSGTNSADYIEIFNSSSTYDSLFFDTLKIITSNNTYRLTNVGIKKGDFYTIAGTGVPNQTEWSIDNILNFDLTSTSEVVFLKTKNDKLIDKIFYVAQNGFMGWPVIGSSARTSMILDTLYEGQGPKDNNYGTSWIRAVSDIHANHSDYKGTPGRPGH